MKLHTLPPSANSHGCIAVVKHLKAEDKVEIINAYGKTRTPEFLAINPCHTCPTLEITDGVAIWESNAIMRHLATTLAGGEDLYPKDPIMRAKIDMVLDWRQTSLYKNIPDIAYCIFGMPVSDEGAKKSMKELLDEHFPVLLDVYLKDTPFVYSDKPTIADLGIAPVLTFIKTRAKFWDAVPDKVKEYHTRVLEAFPGTKENFDMLDGMATGYDGEGADLEP